MSPQFLTLIWFLSSTAIHCIPQEFDVFSKIRSSDDNYQKMIESHGYSFEEHFTVTADGYIIRIWHLPSKSSTIDPVILQHGLLDDAWSWFNLKNNNSLPYVLVDAGYDVWVPSIRGSMFSNHHTDPSKTWENPFSSYWDFSFADMAEYDLTSVINYIKQLTHVDKVNYVGHSQGTTIFFLNYMLNPNFLESSVKNFAAVGPVPSVSYISSGIVRFLGKYINQFDQLYPFGNFLNFGPGKKSTLKRWTDIIYPIIKTILDIALGTEVTDRINYKDWTTLFFYEPGGTSKKNMLHWLQCYNNKQMRRFDYGEVENLKRYGTRYPPAYDTELFAGWSINTLITVTEIDPFSSIEDVYGFINKVANKDLIKELHLNMYNHLDYLWSEDAKEDIYVKIVDWFDGHK